MHERGEHGVAAVLTIIWSELLDLPPDCITPASDFHELGGNSMLLLSLQMAISQQLGAELAIDALQGTGSFAGQLALVLRQ